MNATLLMRWTARVLSVGLAALFAAFAIGEGLPPLQPVSIQTLSFALLSLALGGLLIAWRFEAVGAAVALAGAIGFYLVDFATSEPHAIPNGWVFPLLIVAPLLYLTAVASERFRAPHAGEG